MKKKGAVEMERWWKMAKEAFGERESGGVLGGGDGRGGGFNLALVEVVAAGVVAEVEVFGGCVVLADGIDEFGGDARFFVAGGKVGSVSSGHGVFALSSQRVRRTSRMRSFAGRNRARVRLRVDRRRVQWSLI
jgi:hypothetical protein